MNGERFFLLRESFFGKGAGKTLFSKKGFPRFFLSKNLMQFFNDLSRAFGSAEAAAGALTLVDRGDEVVDGNGTDRAILLADLARDAAGVALFARLGAVLDRVASNEISARDRDHGDDLLGANLGASAATGAFVRIDDGKPVLDVDRVKVAGGNTGTES